MKYCNQLAAQSDSATLPSNRVGDDEPRLPNFPEMGGNRGASGGSSQQ